MTKKHSNLYYESGIEIDERDLEEFGPDREQAAEIIRYGYFRIPRPIRKLYNHIGIDRHEYLLLDAIMCNFNIQTRTYRATNEQLADQIGISPRQVIRLKKSLVKNGMIKAESIRRNGKNEVTTYDVRPALMKAAAIYRDHIKPST
jgi:DNA-binding transcriptional regulator YdaS (Cro superfamily)